jgi:hypothetical protein
LNAHVVRWSTICMRLCAAAGPRRRRSRQAASEHAALYSADR